MVHALDRKTGKSLWTFMTGARVDSSPVIAGGLAYIGSNDGKLYVLDVATGKSVFQFEAGGPLSASPAHRRQDGWWSARRHQRLVENPDRRTNGIDRQVLGVAVHRGDDLAGRIAGVKP